jgi:hypothetical protein
MGTDGDSGKWTVDGGERRVGYAITADYEIYRSRNVLERRGDFLNGYHSLQPTPNTLLLRHCGITLVSVLVNDRYRIHAICCRTFINRSDAAASNNAAKS